MKKIQYILFALAIALPFGASAATFSIVPNVGTIKPGNTITSSVYANPGAGETISATKVLILFPASKMEALSYTPVSGGSILAHIGTKINNTTGTIIDNVAFNPAITTSTKIATITFKAKKEGAAKVTFSSNSKLLDKTTANRYVSSTGASFTIKVPVVTPKAKAKKTVNRTKKNVVNTAVQTASVTKATTSAQTSTVASSSATSTLPVQTAAAAGSGSSGKTVPYAIATIVAILALLAWLNRKRLFPHAE